jgi:hypothetical protein
MEKEGRGFLLRGWKGGRILEEKKDSRKKGTERCK